MGEKPRHILVVDDEAKIRRLLRNCLEPEGFVVFEAENRSQLEACLDTRPIDLVTLDLNLGADNGLAIAAELKKMSNIPIIIVTGKGDVIDRVVGLEIGADDYIAKPFHVREVVARVRSVLRRAEGNSATTNVQLNAKPGQNAADEGNKYHFRDWTADFDRFELTAPDGKLCELTTADFNLLKVLLQNPKKVLSREQIMDRISGHDWQPYDRTIDNQIARLRKKLEDDPAKPKLIKTVRGIGYTFSADVK